MARMHGDQLREDGGDPVQHPGIGIGEPLGPVVEVHRFLVVVAPESRARNRSYIRSPTMAPTLKLMSCWM